MTEPLNTIIHTPIGELASLEAYQLYELLEVAKLHWQRSKQTKQWLESAIAMKYSKQLLAKRQRLGKDTGIIHLDDNGFKLTNDIPKKPAWDQQKLAEVISKIEESGDDPSEYVEVTYKVPESKFKSWPSSIQNIFEPARTLKTGQPSYVLTPEHEEV